MIGLLFLALVLAAPLGIVLAVLYVGPPDSTAPDYFTAKAKATKRHSGRNNSSFTLLTQWDATRPLTDRFI